MSRNKIELLAKWYLRFNGYFIVDNFTVHPDTKKGKEVEADFLAVRFPYSTEEPGQYCFQQDEKLVLDANIDFLIMEVKSGVCSLNDTWKEPERGNIQYALRWMGFGPDEGEINSLAKSLYSSGCAVYNDYVIRLVSLGRKFNKELFKQFLGMVQIELMQAAESIRNRLTTGCAKLNRDNWDEYTQGFAKRAEEREDAQDFLNWTLGNNPEREAKRE